TYFFFFFSSRRRHTRSYGDWSSDVCSSDLYGCAAHPDSPGRSRSTRFAARKIPGAICLQRPPSIHFAPLPETEPGYGRNCGPVRSEERRVGKECRLRWATEREDKRRRRM